MPERVNASSRGVRDQGFLPDFCALRPVFAVIVGAEVLSIILVLGSPRPLDDFWPALSLVSLYALWIGLGGAAALCALRRPLQRSPVRRAGLVAWLVLLLVAGAVCGAASQLDGVLALREPARDLLARTLGVTAIVAALLLRYLYLHHQWQRQVMAETEARLQALQARIRPHFLFNSMNIIAQLTRSRPEVAEEVVQDLADLFRAALSDVRSVSTLAREIELGRRYLNIERLRLGERLQVDWQIAGLPMDAALPPLVLQPLLENAVYHGVEPTLSPGVVRIVGAYGRGEVALSIRNPLPASQEERHREGNRLAVDNIRRRLDGMFHGRARLVQRRLEGEYQVDLVFPHPWGAP